MLNNNPNPLRAAYPELGNRTAMEALRGAGIYVGPGPVPDWAKVQLDPTGGDVVTTAAGVACTPPAGMPGVTDVQKAVDALVPYEVGDWSNAISIESVNQGAAPLHFVKDANTTKAAFLRLGNLVMLSFRLVGMATYTHETKYKVYVTGVPYRPITTAIGLCAPNTGFSRAPYRCEQSPSQNVIALAGDDKSPILCTELTGDQVWFSAQIAYLIV